MPRIAQVLVPLFAVAALAGFIAVALLQAAADDPPARAPLELSTANNSQRSGPSDDRRGGPQRGDRRGGVDPSGSTGSEATDTIGPGTGASSAPTPRPDGGEIDGDRSGDRGRNDGPVPVVTPRPERNDRDDDRDDDDRDDRDGDDDDDDRDDDGDD